MIEIWDVPPRRPLVGYLAWGAAAALLGIIMSRLLWGFRNASKV